MLNVVRSVFAAHARAGGFGTDPRRDEIVKHRGQNHRLARAPGVAGVCPVRSARSWSGAPTSPASACCGALDDWVSNSSWPTGLRREGIG